MAREARKLTENEIRQVETMAGIGMTNEQIAAVLGISKKTLERRQGSQKGVGDALLKGRARASGKVLETAYKMATSGKHVAMTIFWLKCREGWKEPEVAIADGDRTIKLAYAPKSKETA